MAIVLSFAERLGTTDGVGDIHVAEAESASGDPLDEAVDLSFTPDNEDVTAAAVAEAATAVLLISLASDTEVI
uniref:Uncharacterized protein n=1 Tax=Arion vulgaris TaxID=1028688 RepID=A0A0B6ZSP6_9EUPU